MFDVEAFVREEWPKNLPLRMGEKAKQAGDCEMAIMYYGGDFKLIWNPENADEVDAAKTSMERLRKKGFNAYKVEGKDGAKGELFRGEFDPNVGRLIMVPPVAGGRGF